MCELDHAEASTIWWTWWRYSSQLFWLRQTWLLDLRIGDLWESRGTTCWLTVGEIHLTVVVLVASVDVLALLTHIFMKAIVRHACIMLFPFIRVPIARRWNNSSKSSPLFSRVGHSKLWVSWASSALRFAYWPHKICCSCWSCLSITNLKHLEGIMTGFRVVESVPSKINHRRWLHLLTIQCVNCCGSGEATWFCSSGLSELTVLIFKALARGGEPCGWSLGHSGLSQPSLLLVL